LSTNYSSSTNVFIFPHLVISSIPLKQTEALTWDRIPQDSIDQWKDGCLHA